MANTPTANYGYNKPAIGDSGWGTTLNDNWDALDADLIAEHEADGTHGAITPTSINTAGTITMADDQWIGLGAGSARLVFDTTGDRACIMGTAFGIGTLTPGADLEVTSNAVTNLDVVSDNDNNSADNDVVLRLVENGSVGAGGTIKCRLQYDEGLDQVTLGYGANNHIVITSTGITRFGGTANYAQHAADGELTLAGTARVTKCVIFSNAALSKGTTAADPIIVTNFHGYSFDIGDDATFVTKLPNDWATGTDVLINIRWCINEAYVTNSGEVNWQATWLAVPADSSEAINGAGTTDSTGDINIPATAYYLTQNTVETIAGASLAAGDEIGIKLSRIDILHGSGPTADPVITCVALQYTADKLGTAT